MTTSNRCARARNESNLQPSSTPSQSPSRVTIECVSDEILLNTFRYYLDVSPRDWPRLVHTCRKWRRIALASREALRLRLFCTNGTPVKRTLHFWPALPIVVEYGGSPTLDPPAPEDEDNIIAALKQADRVISISLTVTYSLMGKLSAIEEPFSELQDLILLSRDAFLLILPITFRWGQCLRRLHSTGVDFSAHLQPLYLGFSQGSSTNIMDLQLNGASPLLETSPIILKNVLSEMTQLRSLSLQFRSTTNYRFPLPPYGERAVLPTLTSLNFQGSMAYLEGIVAIIDAPSLEDIDITSDNSFLALPYFKNFVGRMEMHRSHIGAQILSSEPTISISLTRPGAPTRLKLQVLCKPFRTQIFSTAQFCLDFSPLLFNDDGDTRIGTTRAPARADSSHKREWIGLFNKITDRRHKDMLPAPHKLYVRQPGPRDAVLREAVVSSMIYHRLSGHPIEVEYERQCDIDKQREAGSSFQQETIEMVCEDILLNIFNQYLDATPQFWPTLVWVCQKWRRIVFTSPLGLNIRIHCTYKIPVLKALCYWPALPITIQYGGAPNLDPPALEDDDNIIAALKQPDRVSSIILTVTSSLLEKLSAISEPFTELEDFVIFSQDNLQLTFPSSFHFGPRLRTLHLIRIAIPSFPQLLSPSQFLVDIQLHDIPITGYFSPEAFANALSGTTQVQSLLLYFRSLPPRQNYLAFPPPSGERVVLPALTCLKYRGTSKYLDSFVARIDAARLGELNIAFFFQPTMVASQLGRFIERAEMQTSLIQAVVEASAHAISISLTHSRASTRLRLQISCKQLDWQLSCMAQVCHQFSPFLFHVNNVGINTTEPPREHDGVADEQWLDLLRSFSGARDISVSGEHATAMLCAFRRDGDISVLPSLRHLRVQKPIVMDGPSWDSVQSFITSRWISGHPPVEVNAPSYRCHICHRSSEEQLVLKRHLRDKHGYQIFCSYCGEFRYISGRRELFREHIGAKHPEIAHNDGLISNRSLTLDQLGELINRHSFLRPPDVVELQVGETEYTELRLHSQIARDSDSLRDAGERWYDASESWSDAGESDSEAYLAISL